MSLVKDVDKQRDHVMRHENAISLKHLWKKRKQKRETQK